jgi:hypothetical protein
MAGGGGAGAPVGLLQLQSSQVEELRSSVNLLVVEKAAVKESLDEQLEYDAALEQRLAAVQEVASMKAMPMQRAEVERVRSSLVEQEARVGELQLDIHLLEQENKEAKRTLEEQVGRSSRLGMPRGAAQAVRPAVSTQWLKCRAYGAECREEEGPRRRARSARAAAGGGLTGGSPSWSGWAGAGSGWGRGRRGACCQGRGAGGHSSRNRRGVLPATFGRPNLASASISSHCKPVHK